MTRSSAESGSASERGAPPRRSSAAVRRKREAAEAPARGKRQRPRPHLQGLSLRARRSPQQQRSPGLQEEAGEADPSSPPNQERGASAGVENSNRGERQS